MAVDIKSKDWDNLPVEQRQAFYFSVIAGLTVALEGDRNYNLTDEELALLGYFWLVDKEAQDIPFTMTFDDGTSKTIVAKDEIRAGTLENPMITLNKLGDPRAPAKTDFSSEWTRGHPFWQWDVATPERLQIPVSAAALIVGFKAAGGAVAPALGNFVYSNASILGNFFYSNAARVAASAPSQFLIKLAKYGSAVAITTGVPGLVTSIADNVRNYDENQIAIMDAQSVAEAGTNSPEQWNQIAMAGVGDITPLSIGEIEPAASYIDRERTQSAIDAGRIEWLPKDGSVRTPGNVPLSQQMFSSTSGPPSPDETMVDFRDNPYIGGFSMDYDPTVGRGPTYNIDEGDAPMDADTHRQRYVRYHETDLEDIVESMTPGQLVAFQTMAEKAILIDPGGKKSGVPYVPGTFDEATRWALNVVLTQANTEGVDWHKALSDMAIRGQALQAQLDAEDAANAPKRPAYTYETYLEPDWASLAATAKNAIRETLGRDANEWEMDLLAEQMKSYKRDQFNAEQAAAKSYYDAQGRAQDTAEPTSGGTVSDVDANARFAEFFETKFANELQRKKKVTDVANATGDLMSGFDTAASIVGGR